MISFRFTSLIVSLSLLLPASNGAEVRCCRDCATSTDCSDVGDYLGETVNEDGATFCSSTLSGFFSTTYSVCDPGTTNPGSGAEMCCDPNKACGAGKSSFLYVSFSCLLSNKGAM